MSSHKGKIVILQKKNEEVHAPYLALAQRQQMDLLFKPLTEVERISLEEFRKERTFIGTEVTALIFTNKTAIDFFFELIEEARVPFAENEKHYFCANPQLKNYLGKYVKSKRRRRAEEGGIEELFPKLKRYKKEVFLFPCSNVPHENIHKFFTAPDSPFRYKEQVIYRHVPRKIEDLLLEPHDILLFFSPFEAKSFFQQYPHFTQAAIQIAVRDAHTADEVLKAGRRVDFRADALGSTSLADALAHHLAAAPLAGAKS